MAQRFGWLAVAVPARSPHWPLPSLAPLAPVRAPPEQRPLQTRVPAWKAETETQLHPAVPLSATPAAVARAPTAQPVQAACALTGSQGQPGT